MLKGKCRVVQCLTLESEREDRDGPPLSARETKEQDRISSLFSNIINDGRLGGDRDGNPPGIIIKTDHIEY